MTRDELDRALIKAHRDGNGPQISRLYGTAGNAAGADGRVDEACFFWTHAYVFALEAGLPDAEIYRACLQRYGREQ